jgi:hypothetical protein
VPAPAQEQRLGYSGSVLPGRVVVHEGGQAIVGNVRRAPLVSCIACGRAVVPTTLRVSSDPSAYLCALRARKLLHLHHSVDPRHWNKNFGFLLSYWDRMAGTIQYCNAKKGISFGIMVSDQTLLTTIPFSSYTSCHTRVVSTLQPAMV